MRWLRMVVAIAAGLSASAASAEASAKDMLAVIDAGAPQADKVRIWINGSVSGLVWANAELQAKSRPKFFCQPQNLQLTLDGDVNILRQYLKRHPSDATEKAGMVMMEAMEEKFPCAPSK